MKKNGVKKINVALDGYVMTGAFLGLAAGKIYAGAQVSAASLPWEGPIQAAFDSIQGPVATGIAGMLMIGTFLMYAMGESQGMGKTGLRLIIGVSGALLVTNIISFITDNGR